MPDPGDTSADAGAFFKAPIIFLKGVVDMGGLPDSDRSEICFAGRSNVGKSTLINSLVGQRNLARTSNTPGRTQEINFFTIDDPTHPIYLVDLPGYGYAKAGKKAVAGWNKLIRAYMQGRPNLRQVFLLIDARHGIKDNDLEILKMLDEAAVSYQIVLTKADKLSREDQEKRIAETAALGRKHVACHPEVLLSSGEKGWGLDDIRARIFALAD